MVSCNVIGVAVVVVLEDSGVESHSRSTDLGVGPSSRGNSSRDLGPADGDIPGDQESIKGNQHPMERHKHTLNPMLKPHLGPSIVQ